MAYKLIIQPHSQLINYKPRTSCAAKKFSDFGIKMASKYPRKLKENFHEAIKMEVHAPKSKTEFHSTHLKYGG